MMFHAKNLHSGQAKHYTGEVVKHSVNNNSKKVLRTTHPRGPSITSCGTREELSQLPSMSTMVDHSGMATLMGGNQYA